MESNKQFVVLFEILGLCYKTSLSVFLRRLSFAQLIINGENDL